MLCCNIDARKGFFNVSIIIVWYGLPGRVVEAGSLSTFKGLYFDYLEDFLLLILYSILFVLLTLVIASKEVFLIDIVAHSIQYLFDAFYICIA